MYGTGPLDSSELDSRTLSDRSECADEYSWFDKHMSSPYPVDNSPA